MKGTLELTGMEFHAYHGCLDFEKRDGNLFIVDFMGELDMSKATVSDSLEDTLDYGRLYDVIKAEMAVHSDLLEHVTGRIINAIAGNFPELDNFSVSVSKQNPPVNGVVAWSKITLYYPGKTI